MKTESQGKSERRNGAGASELFSRGIAVVLSLTLTVTLVNGQAGPQTARPTDGQTLYKALFFGSGPLVNKIPTLHRVLPYFPAEYKNLEGPITKYIQAKDPSFFQNFAKEIQSGDRVRVAAEIKRANLVQREALLEATKASNTKFALSVRRLKNQTAGATEPGKEPDAENDANVAVEVEVWLFILVVILAFWLKQTPSRLQGLSFEQYVDEIVRAVPKSGAVLKP